MTENPFSNFQIEMPKKYQEQIKRFCRTGGGMNDYIFVPFERQVDFWFFAFLLAVNENLPPVKERDTYNATIAGILGSDPYRITHIQAVFLGIHNDLEALSEHRKVFDFALDMANAGIPKLIQILSDNDNRPIWNVLEELEKIANG